MEPFYKLFRWGVFLFCFDFVLFCFVQHTSFSFFAFVLLSSYILGRFDAGGTPPSLPPAEDSLPSNPFAWFNNGGNLLFVTSSVTVVVVVVAVAGFDIAFALSARLSSCDAVVFVIVANVLGE